MRRQLQVDLLSRCLRRFRRCNIGEPLRGLYFSLECGRQVCPAFGTCRRPVQSNYSQIFFCGIAMPTSGARAAHVLSVLGCERAALVTCLRAADFGLGLLGMPLTKPVGSHLGACGLGNNAPGLGAAIGLDSCRRGFAAAMSGAQSRPAFRGCQRRPLLGLAFFGPDLAELPRRIRRSGFRCHSLLAHSYADIFTIAATARTAGFWAYIV